MKESAALKAGINIDKDKFVKLINQQVDQAVSVLPPQQIDMGEVFLSKKGDLKVDIIGQDILLSIPLGIQFIGKRLLGLVEAQGAIELSFRTKIDFQPYWQLITDTKVERYTWLDKPDVQFSILNFSVEKMADQFLGKNKKKIEGEVDKAIANFWNKAGVAMMAEAFFQKSHQLRPGLSLFLQLLPERIQLSPTVTKDAELSTQLDCLLNIDLSSIPQEQKKEALPTPSFDIKEENEQSDINVNVSLHYSDIEQILASQLKGQSFSYKEKTVIFSSLQLNKTNTALHFNISLSGFIEGNIEMDCLPIYNKQENQITMQIQAFEMKATSFWKKSIVNLFSDRIKKEMEERLQYKLDDIITLKEVKRLRGFSPKDGIKAAIDIQKISLSNFIVGKKGIDCLLKATAELSVSL
jgi:hypothetical protein